MELIQNYKFSQTSSKVAFDHKLMKYTLKLHHLMSRNSVQEVVEATSELISNSYIPYLTHQLNNDLKPMASELVRGRVIATLEENKNPFRKFSSEHLRFDSFEAHSVFVKPTEYLIGTLNVLVKNEPISRPIKGVHCTLIHTLKVFLELPGIYDEMTNYISLLKNEKNVVCNFLQAELY